MTAPIRVGFCGLAHSHPYSDAEGLRASGARLIGVHDANATRAADFSARFDCPVRSTVAALLADAPDVVIATPHPDDLIKHLAEIIPARIPVFLNKTVAADRSRLRRLDDALRHADPRQVGTASVLRFSPGLQRLRAQLRGAVRRIEVHVRHDTALFLTPDRRWQDDPTVGGGTLVTIGTHAWEIVDVLAPGAKLIAGRGTTRRNPGSTTLSEDEGVVVGELTQAGGGVAEVQATVSGASGPERYAVTVRSDRGSWHAELDTTHPRANLGYDGLVRAVLDAATTRTVPVSWAESRTVVSNTIEAALIARGD